MRGKQAIEKTYSELLKFCFEQYFLTKNQMKNWLMKNNNISSLNSLKSTLSLSLKYFRDNNLIVTHPASKTNQEEYYSASNNGLSFLKENGLISHHISYQELDNPKWQHDYYATEIRQILESILDVKKWESDRIMKAETEDKLPDAALEHFMKKNSSHIKIAVEIELSQKAKSRYETKFHDYELSPYDIVLYFVSEENLKKLIINTASNFTNIIYVALIEDFFKSRENTLLVSHHETLTFKKGFQL